jgi:hypothetical protein
MSWCTSTPPPSVARTDLHILQGDVPAVTDGRVLGHEAVGTVTEVGNAVTSFKVGDRVLVPAITRCGRCEYCQRNMPSHWQAVGGIGWIFGHLIDGTQAESVRVPYADTSLYLIPEEVSDEQAIFLADSLPTGYEVGVLAGGVRPGDTVAVVGAGAVGLSAVLTTGLWGAARVIAVDSNKFRLEKALEFGATDTVEVGPNTVSDVMALADGPAWTWQSRRWATPRRCSPRCRWSDLVAPWQTSACTGRQWRSPWRRCGSRTSAWPWVWSTQCPSRPCSRCSTAARFPLRRWTHTPSRSTRSTRPTTSSRNAADNLALKVVIQPA